MTFFNFYNKNIFMNYKKAYIYEIINNINKKTYVGQHKSKTEKDNYFGSGTVLNQAFDKYGKENFSKIILEEIPLNENLQEELNKKEIFWINKRKSEGKAEYNISGGGQCCSNPFLYKTEEEKKMIYEKMGKTRTGISSKVAGKRIKHTKKETLPKEEISKKFKKINREKLGKEIIVMETEEVFNSTGDFMDKYGVPSDTSWVSKAARSNGLKKALGFHICYKENYSREYNQWFGKERGNISPKLGKRQISDMSKSILFNKTNFGTKIICNETGEEFNSIKECCEKLKIKHNDIKNFLNGKRKYPIAGYTFKSNN